ncbi:hypothetical protein [Tabrizicola flagellatus]|uniref:hypothetical protein n=1 Tax=Tabrizicola flagellatus TaxID=2593021 RepID=UPI0011F12571|nr:hypothetical protein [Tabrizicola flagellatus]
MVGPLSSEEIEDVVSSVRRLVSNELRPKTLSRDLSADRLLLTAALRVVPESSPLAPLVLDAPVVESPSGDDHPLANPEPDETGGLSPSDPGSTGPDGRAGDTPGASTKVAAEPLADSEPDLTPVLPDSDDETGSAVDPASEMPDPATVAEDPGDGELPDADEPMWESGLWAEPAPASLGEVALAGEEAEVLIGSTGTELSAQGQEAEPASAQNWHEAEDTRMDPEEPVPFVPLHHRRAEQMAARQAAAEAVPHEEAGQPGAAAGNQEASGPEPTEFVDVDGMPLAVLDEAALQEIVRQTLRSELQGELGERITRSIRKLVRAEINRAFIARDLD